MCSLKSQHNFISHCVQILLRLPTALKIKSHCLSMVYNASLSSTSMLVSYAPASHYSPGAAHPLLPSRVCTGEIHRATTQCLVNHSFGKGDWHYYHTLSSSKIFMSSSGEEKKKIDFMFPSTLVSGGTAPSLHAVHKRPYCEVVESPGTRTF